MSLSVRGQSFALNFVSVFAGVLIALLVLANTGTLYKHFDLVLVRECGGAFAAVAIADHTQRFFNTTVICISNFLLVEEKLQLVHESG